MASQPWQCGCAGQQGCGLSPASPLVSSQLQDVQKSRDLSRATASSSLFSWFASKVHAHHPTPHKLNQALKCAGQSSLGKPRVPQPTDGLSPLHQPPCFSEGPVAPAAHLAMHSSSTTAPFPSRQPLPACWRSQRGRIGPLEKLGVQVTSTTQAPLRKNPLLIVK